VPPVVVLDACVLYPAAQRDLFMWLAAGAAIRAHWTNDIHDEWMRNVARDFGVARDVLERVRNWTTAEGQTESALPDLRAGRNIRYTDRLWYIFGVGHYAGFALGKQSRRQTACRSG
jgi:hypothetical protein